MRTQLVATLCLVLVPAFVIALLLIHGQARTVEVFRRHAVEQSADLIATKIDARLQAAYLLGGAVIDLAATAPGDTVCASLSKLAMARDGGWAIALFRNGHRLCTSAPRPGGGPWPLPAPPGSAAFTLAPAPDPSRILMTWTHGSGIGADLSLPKNMFLDAADLAFLGPLGSGVIDGTGRLLAGRAPGADAIVAPIGQTALHLAVDYVPPRFFALRGDNFWGLALEAVALLATTILGAIWAIDRTTGRWIGYFRRVAIAHSRGRLSVRAGRLDDAPLELAELGTAINRMAGNMADHARMIEETVAERTHLWQELQHRVKNNFQVIASLLSLYKKTLPPDRQADIRFVEDHVQSMAIAYRVAYAPKSNNLVSPLQLLKEVVAALRDTAKLDANRVLIESEAIDAVIDLDKAISLGLYLAYFIPPHLDRLASSEEPMKITVRMEADTLLLAFSHLPPIPELHTALRQRLIDAYIRQLRAAIDMTETSVVMRIPGQNAATPGPGRR